MIQIPLTSATDGMTGIPLPYLLHSDPMVTCIMFLCMLLVSVVFAHGKKHFLQGLKNFVRGRERGSMFDEVTASDVRHTIVLVFHTCLMLAFGVYRYLAQSAPALFEQYSHLGILAGLTAIFILFLLFKWAAYSLVNSLFFQKVRNELWICQLVHLAWHSASPPSSCHCLFRHIVTYSHFSTRFSACFRQNLPVL